jgi:hypothetical protein
MGFISSFKDSLGAWIKSIFKKKRAKIGIYGPPNAGKTTLAKRIVHDWSGDDDFGNVSHIPHETRRAMRKEGVVINANGSSIELDIVDTPGMATKIDFKEFMAFGLSDQTGFNNPKYFARYFKDEFGVLPSVYAQEFKKKQE